MPPRTYWEVYESQLSGFVKGIPLWIPGPYEEQSGWKHIRLADVGYMFEGSFVTLFNAGEFSPPSSSQETPYLYPQEKIRDALIRKSKTDKFTSTSVGADVAIVDTDSENVQISATLTCASEEGAALILPGPKESVKIHSTDLRHGPSYAEYCFAHRDDWLRASGEAAKPDIELKDLIFVTGIDNVDAWSLFSFQRQSNYSAFKLTTGPSAASGCQLDIQSTTKVEYSPATNFGPGIREHPSSPDQTVVLRRFKMHSRKKWRWPWQRNRYSPRSPTERVIQNAVNVLGIDDPRSGSLPINDDNVEENAGQETDPPQHSKNDGKVPKRKRLGTNKQEDYDDGSNVPDDRRSGGPGPGGAGGAGGGNSGTGGRLPPGNGGGRLASGPAESGGDTGGGSGRSTDEYQSTKREMAMYYSGGDIDNILIADSPYCGTRSSASDSSSISDSVECEPLLEPLDTLLEYILEACPEAEYSCAGDDDLLRFQEHLRNSNWRQFPGTLRRLQPSVRLRPNGLASLLGSECNYPAPLPVSESTGIVEDHTDSSRDGSTASMATPNVLETATGDIDHSRSPPSSVMMALYDHALWQKYSAVSDSDDDTDECDSDSSVTTRDCFTVRHGRRIHSHGNSPYPLPADEIEMQRLRGEHDGFRLLMNGFIFFGPVNQVLANDPERRKRVLDLCTGQGVWVEQMAPLYPHVKFYGVDMVPLATRYPPVNAQFEVHDVRGNLRWPNRSIDMVHIRNALLGIQDYPRLLREVARVLRRGGLFLSREWALGIYMVDGSGVADAAPGAHAFCQCISGVLRQRGIFSLGHEIADDLHHSRRFTEINAEAQHITLGNVDGDQRLNELGNQFRNLTLQWGIAMRGMLLDSGRSAANVDALLGAFSHDIQNVQGLKVVSHIVHARRNNIM